MNTFCKLMVGGALLGVAASQAAAQATSADARIYPASALIAPCRTADADSREEGAAAQVECEQYLLGFVDALAKAGAGKLTCPPAVNTGSEVRWAFMRWVYGDYAARSRMSAGEAVLAALKEAYPCK